MQSGSHWTQQCVFHQKRQDLRYDEALFISCTNRIDYDSQLGQFNFGFQSETNRLYQQSDNLQINKKQVKISHKKIQDVCYESNEDCEKNTNGKKIRKKGAEEDYEKHIFANMAKKAHELALETLNLPTQYQAHFTKKGWYLHVLQNQFQFQNFNPTTMASKLKKTISSGRNVYLSIFQHILRKRYILYVMRVGKMRDVAKYIKFKKYPLYLANHLQ